MMLVMLVYCSVAFDVNKKTVYVLCTIFGIFFTFNPKFDLNRVLTLIKRNLTTPRLDLVCAVDHHVLFNSAYYVRHFCTARVFI